MPLLAGLLALLLTFYFLRAYVSAPPALLAKIIRNGAGFVIGAVAALCFARGRIDLGMALGGFAYWLMRQSAGTPGMRKAGAGGAGKSRVRTAMVEMELDHATGAIRGVILAGPNEGKELDALTRPELMALFGDCRRDDPDAARVLEAYFDRRFPGWRQAGDAHRDPGEVGGAPPPRGKASISEDEAYKILGLKKGAAAADIARAHRELMKKFHPDHGGTTDLAARVNEAKDVLLRRQS
jgi:hypothetical protein